MPKATVSAAAQLLTPRDHALILIDHQSQMAFPLRSIDVGALRNNVSMLARAAVGFRVSTIITTVAAKAYRCGA